MKHTYLLQEGKWQAFGEYTDETNTTIQARGGNDHGPSSDALDS